MLLASEFDKSKYLKATDLDHEKKFRIKSVTAEELGVGKDKETKLVVWFTNDDRGLVLNKTNNRTLRSAFGDDTAGWANKVIAVFPTLVESNGKPGLRVRILPPKQAAAATPATTQQPASPGNGAAIAASRPSSVTPAVDPELEPDPKLSVADEMADEIPENW